MPNQREQPHVFLRNEVLTNDRYSYSRRYIERDTDTPEVKDYSFQQQRFADNLSAFESDQTYRHEHRDLSLNIPAHIDYIEIRFFKPFGGDLENIFVQHYGLSPAKYRFFNKMVLFAISDEQAFERFKEEIRAFLESADPRQDNGGFKKQLLLIEAFRFFSSSDIKESFMPQLSYLELLNEGLTPAVYRAISERLFSYLQEQSVLYTYDANAHTIEVRNMSDSILNLILDNFDIIGKVNASHPVRVTPGRFGEARREYSFSISGDENLPIIGIVDTGVSDQTPLAALIVNPHNHSYDLTGAGPKVDKVEHGTAVAGLAALGSRLITQGDISNYAADAQILSIKVMDENAAILQRSQVLSLIRRAHEEMGVRIFTLTITENDRNKRDNEETSKYAYLLDKLAYELDILIFIAAGNRTEGQLTDFDSGKLLNEYPDLFLAEESNLEVPAESLNNMTVGAIADNFEEDNHTGITPNKQFPAIFTRKFHFDEEKSSLTKFQKNNGLFKPDVVFQGGDYDTRFDWGNAPALKLLSTRINNEGGFHRNIGTSFATPLAANLAARIISRYPNIRMQTVKALIINSADYPWQTKKIPDELTNIKGILQQVIGHGIPDIEACLSSSDDEITIIREGLIRLDEHIVIPIWVPDYLLTLDKTNVLEIKATLCFKFDPVFDNHLGYCPIHMSFGVFRNKEINEAKVDDIKLKSTASWSEDYYFKAKLLSNVQKVRVNIDKDNIRRENSQFRIAVRAKPNKILPERMLQEIRSISHPFSLVVKIKELGKMSSGRLYSEMHAVNNMEAITTIELEAEGNVQ